MPWEALALTALWKLPKSGRTNWDGELCSSLLRYDGFFFQVTPTGYHPHSKSLAGPALLRIHSGNLT